MEKEENSRHIRNKEQNITDKREKKNEDKVGIKKNSNMKSFGKL